jgi:hypothetical protein
VSCTAIIGKDVTHTAIEQLMPKARIIHLATHGLLDDVLGLLIVILGILLSLPLVIDL